LIPPVDRQVLQAGSQAVAEVQTDSVRVGYRRAVAADDGELDLAAFHLIGERDGRLRGDGGRGLSKRPAGEEDDPDNSDQSE
jgi:hypothetical protein